MPGARNFPEAVDHANRRQPAHRSIVCNSIASAIRGEFGDYHATDRTGSTELFVNPGAAEARIFLDRDGRLAIFPVPSRP